MDHMLQVTYPMGIFVLLCCAETIRVRMRPRFFILALFFFFLVPGRRKQSEGRTQTLLLSMFFFFCQHNHTIAVVVAACCCICRTEKERRASFPCIIAYFRFLFFVSFLSLIIVNRCLSSGSPSVFERTYVMRSMQFSDVLPLCLLV